MTLNNAEIFARDQLVVKRIGKEIRQRASARNGLHTFGSLSLAEQLYPHTRFAKINFAIEQE
jgi:hypothetical protein